MNTSFEIAFSKLSILEKFEYVQKIFAMIKVYGNQQSTLQCLEIILSTRKVVHYIDWQEKNPQMMIILKISVRQMFPAELQAQLHQMDQ